MSAHSLNFSLAAMSVLQNLDKVKIEVLAKALSELKGRLFILGMGGSAGNASHAVNDFRKLCNIEAYAPTDNISEFSARANDEGLDTVFSGWLKVSKFNKNDALFIFSVGGGNERKKISVNLIRAIKLAKAVGAKVYGVVGRADGYTARYADIAICIPIIEEPLITPLSEAFQGFIWHVLVSHPLLQKAATKW
jgi:D-sedoheptulose 7-phosphate isomerase